MVSFLSLPAVFLLTLLIQEPSNPVSVTYRSNGADSYSFFVSNFRPAPYQVAISFPEFTNLKADAEIPVEVVLPRGMRDYHLFTIRATASPHRFRYQYKYAPGDPRNVRHEDNLLYQFPYSAGSSFLLGQGYLGKFSHQNEYALDFAMPVGTVVRAARAGVVLETKADGYRGGPDPALRREGNFVRIYHRDGTFADYVHLRQFGVHVQVGQEVRAGQALGLSGNTGYSSEPHLHFAVSIPKYFGVETIAVRFLGPGGSAVTPVEGETYTAVHRP